MSTRAIAESYFQALNRSDVETAIALFAPGATFVSPMGPLPLPDGVRAYLGAFEQSFPRAQVQVTHAIEAGEDVALEATWTGTHLGPLQLPDGRTLPATNRVVSSPFVGIFRVSGGKIVAHRAYWDLGAFMAQLTG
jgi:steroid delta-isomerase-like uncharacterized protein